jgi:hypothetical protein
MAFALLLSLLAARDARLTTAIDRYESAKFAAARDALLELVDAPGLSDEDRAETRTYLAACFLALKDRGSARLQLRELAREQPAAKPSPATFAPDVIALSNEVWAEMEKRRAQEVAPPSAPTPAPAPQIEPPPATAPSGPSRALAFMPLGIGHFARGEPGIGALWLVAELGLFGLSIGGVAKVESFKTGGGTPLIGGMVPRAQIAEANQWNAVYSIAFFAGVAVLVANIVVSVLTWPEGGT